MLGDILTLPRLHMGTVVSVISLPTKSGSVSVTLLTLPSMVMFRLALQQGLVCILSSHVLSSLTLSL